MKKVCRKTPRFNTELGSTKVGPYLFTIKNRVAYPISSSSPWVMQNLHWCTFGEKIRFCVVLQISKIAKIKIDLNFFLV